MAGKGDVQVIKVAGPAEFKAFFEFPWRLYQHDPMWVPPLLSMRHDLLDKAKNASWQYLDGDYYIARRDEETIGTIAAFVNPRHNQFHEENIAWFGFFETINDPQVAQALLNTAETWAQERAYTALRGPQSFTGNDECGLLVMGFERPATLLMPYNPPYYQTLIENAGFAKVMDAHCYYADWNIVNADVRGRFDRLVGKVQQRGKISIRGIDRKNLKAEFVLFKELYNTAWEKNWGFTPMTPAELDAMVASLGQFFDPRLAAFAYVDGDPAGFVMAVPEFNQVLRRAQARPGHPEWFTLLKVLWHWKLRPKIDMARVPLMGVKAEYRNKGVDMVLLHHVINQIEAAGYLHVDCGWILETNIPLTNMVNNMKFIRHSTHRFYEKTL